MVDIASANNSNPLSALGLGAPQDAKPKNQLGQSDFLELLVAQMKHQDPMEPQSNGEFLAQMAQFGTVDGINKMQQDFASLSAALTSNQALQASSLVGRQVSVVTNKTELAAEGGVAGTVQLDSSAADLTISINNAQGELVRTVRVPNASAGEFNFNWDGMNNAGQRATAGSYTITAEGLVGGQRTSFATVLPANVDSVAMGKNGGDIKLNLSGIGPVDINQVQRIN